MKKKINLRYELPVIISIAITIILIIIPTGYEGALIYQGTERCRGEVISTNNNAIIDTGLVRSGEQICEIQILNGRFKGRIVEGENRLNGSLEQDKIFQVGDKAILVIDYQENDIRNVNIIEHYRMDKELILLVLFAFFLIVFAGKTGFRSIISFVISILGIWKILVPFYLKGYNPVLIGLVFTIFLTVIIISLVYGFNNKLVSAALGSILGILASCIIGAIFTDLFQIHGVVMSYSESLLYSGYIHLDLTKIFVAGIFIGSSGAMMDLAVDITSAVNEVVINCPTISKKDAIRSGMNVGRAAMGTMTTTLLLAYSGGYIALLMVFMAQGTPIDNVLNYKFVASEILDTIIGSFGLVLVAPFTALTSGWLLVSRKEDLN